MIENPLLYNFFLYLVHNTTPLRGGSRIFLTLVKKYADEVGIRDALGVVRNNWGFGRRCEPPCGDRGGAPKALAYSANFKP